MEAPAMRQRIEESRDGFLATAGADGRPHAVPIGFALDGAVLYFAIDAKPKQTVNLKRLRNIAANPRVAVLFDHYEEDWSRLWWVRIDGTARLVDGSSEARRALDLLVARYPQYGGKRPSGPVVAITIERITGWAAADNPAC